jgi:replicative DNA helicase
MPAPASENPLERIPPHDETAEMGVLGSMLSDAHAAGVGVELLVAEDFYLPRHQVLFALLAELHQQQPDLDPVFVRSELERRGLVERVGGRETLGRLIEGTPTPANIERYCRIVRDRALERSLLQAAGQIIQITQRPEPGETSQDLVQRAEELIFKIADTRSGNEPVSIQSVLNQVLDEAERHVQARREGRELPSPALPTGFADLDRKYLAGGMWPGEVVIVAARPGGGKTTLGINVALNVACRPPEKAKAVGLFSMEMPKEQISKNMLCREARISSTKMRTYAFDEDDYATVKQAAVALKAAPIFIDDTPGLRPNELRERARRLRHRENISLVVIDYLQLMQPGGRHDNREQAVADLSRQVKQLARELKIPVVLLSQLRRAPPEREGQPPTISDLRESGAIEQDADVIIMLHQSLDRETGTRNQRDIKAIIQKNRNGPIGPVDLSYFPDHFRFADYAPETTAGATA